MQIMKSKFTYNWNNTGNSPSIGSQSKVKKEQLLHQLKQQPQHQGGRKMASKSSHKKVLWGKR